MRITKDPETRRLEIVQAARDLFVSKGYENTSIDDIVKQVSVAKGLFYYYFPKKEAVLSAVADCFAEEVSFHIATEMDQETQDLRSLIRRVLGYYLNVIEQNQKLLSITTGSGLEVSRYIKQRLEDHAIEEVVKLLPRFEKSLPLKYPEYTLKILVRGLGDLYLEGVTDIEVITTLIEETLGLSTIRQD